MISSVFPHYGPCNDVFKRKLLRPEKEFFKSCEERWRLSVHEVQGRGRGFRTVL